MKCKPTSIWHRLFAAVSMMVLLQPNAADLSNVPLATLSSGATVKPNLMYLMDTSGSMQQDYTPDWVNDNINYCLNSSSYSKACVYGMPPHNSPDFNSQYYSPDISYTPPIKADGSSYSKMTAANTTNWTAVPVDGYGKEPYIVDANGSATTFSSVGTTWNLVSNYPDLVYSTSAGGVGDPQRNLANASATVNDYKYPDATHTYTTSMTTGAGGPYYYRITGSTVYCTNSSYNDCKTLPALDPANYPTYSVPFSTLYLWCNNNNLGLSTTKCQARRTDSNFKYVSFYGGTIPGVAGVKAQGNFTVAQAGSTSVKSLTTVSSVMITNGAGTYELLSAPVTTTSQVDAATKRNSLATLIKNNITGGGGGCTYTATVSSATVTVKSNETLAICNGTIAISSSDATDSTVQTFGYGGTSTGTATAADNASNTITFGNKTTGGSSTVKSQYVLTLSKLGIAGVNSNTTVSSLLIGGVEALGASVSADGADAAAKYTALATAIANQIHSYHSANPDWDASASGATVTITAPAVGTGNNGLVVKLTWQTQTDAADGVTHIVTFSPATGAITLTGGKDPISAITLQTSLFKRTDIVPATATYPHAPNRSDCTTSTSTCTYAEEMTNFANWFAYYRSRLQTTKSGVSISFSQLTDAYRVGFIDIQGNQFLKLATFDSTGKTAWFAKLFAQTTNASTPLREALSRVGRYYAGKTDGINSGKTSSDPNPIQYSCQQNFVILTTDGYWNGNGGVKLDSSAMDNQDIVDTGDPTLVAGTSTRALGIYDGYPLASSSAGSYGSLADVAAYYYRNDLIPSDTATNGSNNIGINNVPVTTLDAGVYDPATPTKKMWQHMTTFTLGLGVDGRLDYSPTYATDSTGDFNSIVNGLTNCSWESATTNTCNWPIPAADSDTAVDDLWHAAVNGRGKYLSAKTPKDVVTGLNDALAKIGAVKGAAAASATSTPVITQADNQLFLTTYTTVDWTGEVEARTINATTGAISTASNWTAQGQLDTLAQSGGRTIYTRKNDGTRISFDYASFDSTAQAYFTSKGNTLPQYSGLNSTYQALLTNGTAMVNYLRGDQTNEVITLGPSSTVAVYRQRAHILGDTVNAAPQFVKAPYRSYTEHNYTTGFKVSNATRQGVLYVAANDGMLHALNGCTGSGCTGGAELWAYVPRMIMPELYRLASSTYSSSHTYFVDGTPTVEDVWDETHSAWKTILVAGLNGGGISDTSNVAGRGYYALDITDPINPKPLWEFCSNSTLCSVSDSKLGYTFGNAVLGKRARDGKWVVYVSSGYANGSGSTQPGYLFTLDAITGAVLETSATGTEGLGKINGYVTNATKDNTILSIYGGDLQGRVYEFDATAATMAARQIAKLSYSGTEQAITTKPVVSLCQNKRLIMVGTGRYLGTSDVTSTAQYSFYGFTNDIPLANQTLNNNVNMVKQVYDYSNTSNIVVTTSTKPDLSTQYGWYLDFQGSSSGERVNIDPVLAQGDLVVATNIPTTTTAACSSIGGKSRIYDLDYCSGLPFGGANAGGGSTPKVVERSNLLAGVTKFFLSTGEFFTVNSDITGASDTTRHASGSSGFIPGAGRVSWRELIAN